MGILQHKYSNSFLQVFTFNKFEQQKVSSMYRKSVDYNQNSVVHVMDFASFKKKGQHTIQFLIDSLNDNQFRIRKSNNTLIIIIVIADLLIQSRMKNKRPPNKIFKDFIIENIPKTFYNFQHQSTLEQIWAILHNKLKSLQAIQDCLINYNITQFMFLCFGRKTIKDYIQNFKQKSLDLHGNQNQLLMDYNAQLRGRLLHILALALKIDVCVIHRDLSNQLQQNYYQYIGDSRSLNRVEISDTGEYYKVNIFLQQENAKLINANSSQNIIYTGRKKDKQSLDTTIQGIGTRVPQSRSANKDVVKCVKCTAKGKICQCEKSTKKASNSRPQMNINPISTRSIFDNMMGSGFKRQISNQEINSATKN